MSRPPARPSARHRARAPRRPAAPGPLSLHGAPGTSAALETVCGRLAWGVLAAFAATLLAVALGLHRIGDYFTETDFYGAYAEGARLIQHGRLMPSRYGVVGPGYEAVLALVGFVVRDLFVAAELISVAAALVTALLWTGLVRRLTDGRLALFALLFLVTNPVFFRFGYSTTTDALALALQTLALWLLLTRAGPRGALAAGALAAAAFLTRYSAVALLPAGILAISLGATRAPRRGRDALAFAAGFALPVVPWVIYCVSHGSGFSFQLHHNIAYEVFARPRGIVWDDYQRLLQPQFHSLWDVIARDPVAVASRMLFNLTDHLRLDARDLLGWPVAIAALLGLALAALDGTLRRLWPLAAFGALAFLVLVPAFHAARYSLALLPVYAAFAAALFASPRFALAAGRARRVRLKSVLALVPLAAALLGSWDLQARILDQLPVEVLDVAATLRGAARPGDRIIARKPHLAYLSGLEGRPFPFADSLPQLAAATRQQGVRWLYVSWVEVETRPRFWYLLDTTAVVPGLTVRRVTRPHPAVLYEIGPGFGTRPAWMANDTSVTWHTARAQLLVNPDDPAALFHLGLVELSRGTVASASALLERSVRLDPRRAGAWLLLAEIGLRRGDAAATERACRGALAADPGSIDARAALGWASLVAGRPDEAAARWRPVVHAVRDPGTLERMVTLFTETGDLAAAAAARAALAHARGAP